MLNRAEKHLRTVLTVLVALSAFAVPANSFAMKEKPHSGSTVETGSETPGQNQLGDQKTSQTGSQKVRMAQIPQFQREIPFWTFSRGPMYGYVPMDMLSSSNVLQLVVGSFDTRGGEPAFPSELTAPDENIAPGKNRYYLIQLTEKSVYPDVLPGTLKSIEQTGAKLLEYVPNNGYIVRVDSGSLIHMRASSAIQFIKPYHPAYKIQPGIGAFLLTDRTKAASDDYTIIVDVFEGERPAIEEAIRALGGTILPGSETSGSIWADIKGPKIFQLAKLEGVRQIDEYVEKIPRSEESQLIVLNGFYSVGATSSFYSQGVNGSGGYLFDCDCNNDGTVNATGCPGACPVGTTSDIDYNGDGLIDSAAQIVGIVDTGLSTDAGDFAETRANNGVTGSTATSITFKKGHRKMAGYISVPLPGSGDLKTCDSGGSGSLTHGQTTSASAAGNASQVPNGAANGDPTVDWDGDGTPNNYGAGFFFKSGTTDIRVDGVAKGARMYFEDAYNGSCPEGGGETPGDQQADLQNAADHGARIHSFSFGSSTTTPLYSSGAQQIDQFLIKNPTSMFFVSAGNSGNDNGDTDPYGQPQTLDDNAQQKNGITVGACRHDNRLARASFSSIGGAGSGGGPRTKPDLMAPGQDFGGTGLLADYSCRSNDDENTTVNDSDIQCLQVVGFSGTSYSSPNAAGAGAIVRDYFARGMYPDGTKDNPTNDTDRANSISGPLVKAILIASTDHMPGSSLGTNLLRYAHRFNNEEGYGVVHLANALPLTDDPNTPFGMIVHDAHGTLVSSKVQSMSLPTAGLTNGQRACDTFKVIDNSEPLNIVLAWIDDAGDGTGTSGIENDLTLEVTDPGPDGTLGSVANDDVFYYGNIFTEDFNDDGTIDTNCDLAADGTPNESCDFNHDGSLQNGNHSLGVCKSCGDIDGDGTSNNTASMQPSGLCDRDNSGGLTGGECKFKPMDTANVTEAVMLVPDPAGDGTGSGHTADDQIRLGTWRVCVNRVNAANTNTQKFALTISGGVSLQSSVRLDTNPLKCNSDVAVSVTEVADGADPCCTSATSCNQDTCVEPRTRIEVRNAAFKTDGKDNDGDGVIDEVCPTAGCGVCVDADGDGTCESGEDLVDLEQGGQGFQVVQTAGQLAFDTQFRIPASSSSSVAYHFNDGILAIQDGYTVTGFYRDKTSTTVNERKSNSSTDCTASFDLLAIPQVGRNTRFLLTGGCDDDRFFDQGEAFGYQVLVDNLEPAALTKATVTLKARVPAELDGCDNDGDGTIDENDGSEQAADPCRTACRIGSTKSGCNKSCASADVSLSPLSIDSDGDGTMDKASISVGDFNNNIEQIFLGTKAVSFALDVKNTAAFGGRVEMVVGLTSTASGDTVETCQSFAHLLEADNETFRFSTDYPSGATIDEDINADEKISNPIVDPFNPFPNGVARDNFDKLNETITFSDMTTTQFGGGNPGFSGPWDFDVSDNGFRSGIYGASKNGGVEITNWGEDHNFNNILDGPKRCDDPANPKACNADSDCGGVTKCRFQEDIDGNKDGTLQENWGTLGGCGYASRNGTSKGIWHTGTIKDPSNATCAGTNDTLAIKCEYMDIHPGTTGNNDIWLEYLETPVIQKVHKKPDPGGPLCTNSKDDDGDGACVGGTNVGGVCHYANQTAGTCSGFPCNSDCTGGGGCNFRDEKDADGTCREGFAYTATLTDWRWNLNADYAPFRPDGTPILTWEVDMDTTSLDPVDLADGFLLAVHSNGLGPINGSNVNLINGFPMFVLNDPSAAPPVNQRNGVSDSNLDGTIDGDSNRDGTIDSVGNRLSDRSCVFQGLIAASLGPTKRLRDPGPSDDDCDADADPGPDGKPGVAGVDDDGDGIIDDKSELCPCYRLPDAVDDDGDGVVDEPDELQRFWTCSNSSTRCRTNADCGAGTCRQFGKPLPYGDDICGDGTIDEDVTGAFARGTFNSEAGHRLNQNGNWNIGTQNGPFLRFRTIEDVYDSQSSHSESGNSFQAALGVGSFDDDTNANKTDNYGFAIDDMVFEWSETHPITQSPANKCSIIPNPPAGSIAPSGGGDSSSAPPPGPGTAPQCAALSLATDTLFEPSTTISVQLVDTNGSTTQGNFDCTKFGFTTGCGGGNCSSSNDCDNDGLKEVLVKAVNLDEPEGENFRLEQVSSTSDTYRGTIPISSVLNGKNDGIMFVQWHLAPQVFPQFTVQYVDKNDGVTGTSVGTDGRPGLPLVDDDRDSYGKDKKPGVADFDDDGTGVCDFASDNRGTICHVNGDCTGGGTCALIDDWREGCRDTNGDGTVNNSDTHFGDDICTPTDTDGDGTTDVGVDEADELCPAGRKTLFSDDLCGCAVNPIEATVISDFPSADIVITNYKLSETGVIGDTDGIADDQEKLKMKVTVRNLTSGSNLQNVNLRLSTRDANIACITDNSIFAGTMNQRAFVTPASDTFEFIVGSPNRTKLTDEKTAAFQLTATGDLIDAIGNRQKFFGTSVPVTFSMDLDLDASVADISTLKATDKKTIIFNGFTTATACPAGKECYNLTAGDPNNFYKKWTASAFPNRVGMHCQYNDPTNPFNHPAPPGCFLTQDTGAALFLDDDRDGTSESTDWHLHVAASRTNGNKGHSSPPNQGSSEQCLHMGFHDQNGAGSCTDPAGGSHTCENSGGSGASQVYNPTLGSDFDTYHETNVFQIYYNTPFHIGLARGDINNDGTVDEERPALSFWHQMAMVDDRVFGGVVPPTSWDGGAVFALVDRNDDGTVQVGSINDDTKDGFWQKMTPYYGVVTQQPGAFGNCHYDPDDDGNNEKDISPGEVSLGPSSFCFPELVWACVGDTQDGPFNPGLNQIPAGDHCYIEGRNLANAGGKDENGDGTINGGDSGIAGCTGNNCTGAGNWMEAKFDLTQFRGRSIFIRFVTSHGQFGARTWIITYNGTPPTAPIGSANLDDGWWIDDLVVTGLQSGTPYKMRADQKTPPVGNSCGSKCPSNPTAVLRAGTYPTSSNGFDDDGDGSTDESGEAASITCSDAPGRAVNLDASSSTVASCQGGQLEFQFRADDNGDGIFERLVQDFSALSTAIDSPTVPETYQVNVRCSSQTSCAASATTQLVFASAANCEGRITTLTVSAPAATPSISWNVLGGRGAFDVITGDLQTLHPAGNFTAALNAVDNATGGCASDPATPRVCIKNNVSAPPVTDNNPTPAANQGRFYLVRSLLSGGVPTSSSTYNDGTEVTSREPGIAAADCECP